MAKPVEQSSLASYVVVFPIRVGGTVYQPRSIVELSAKDAAGWLQSRYIVPQRQKPKEGKR